MMKVLSKEPLQFYDTVLFLSAGECGCQDFSLFGEQGLITDHLAAMIYRHPLLREIVIEAMNKVVILAIDEQQKIEKN